MNEPNQANRIVCIHGNSSSSSVFECLHNLETPDLKIEAIDLNGHGKNQEMKTEEDFTIKAYKKQLLEIINKTSGQVLLVGNSLGGNLAIEIAEEINGLATMVIMGTPPLKSPVNFQEAYKPSEALNVFLKEDSEVNAVKNAFLIAVQNHDAIPNMISDFQNANPKVRTQLLAELTAGNFKDEYKIFSELDVPKFIIAGNQDPSVNLEYLKKLKDESQGSCELLEFDDCGHYPSMDRPDLFVETIQKIAHAVFE